MKTILILLSPAFGHYNATFRLASYFSRSGYKVIYGGEEEYKTFVETQGFEFLTFPFATFARDRYTNIVSFNKEVIPFFLSNIFKYKTEGMYEDFQRRRFRMLEIIKAIQPDVVFIDAHIPLLYLLVSEVAPCIMVNTTIETNKMPMIPPLSSGFIPSADDKISKFKVEMIWKNYFFRQAINSLFQRVVYMGKDNRSFIRRFSKENSIPLKSILNTRRVLKVGIKNVPEIILAPNEFDYPWLTRKNEVFYAGPSVDLERSEDVLSEDFRERMDQLEELKLAFTHSKVVYCSLGTINIHQNKNCIRFFKNAISAFTNRKGWILIMSIGKDVNKDIFGATAPNIFIFNKLPQLNVLTKSDIMITHGGFNSIKECILKGVPMVVYPLSSVWDQEGNAARVIYHGIGQKGNIERDSPGDIFLKVKSVSEDEIYRKNITEMSKLFQQYDDYSRVIEFVEKYLSKTTAEEVAI